MKNLVRRIGDAIQGKFLDLAQRRNWSVVEIVFVIGLVITGLVVLCVVAAILYGIWHLLSPFALNWRG